MVKKSYGLYTDEETLALLDRIAEQDTRNRSNMMTVLIRQEAERRGLLPPPKPPAES